MTFHVYRHKRRQHACTVFERRCLGTVEALNTADAIVAAMAQFKLPRYEVALEGPNGQRLYGRAFSGRRRPWTMNGE